MEKAARIILGAQRASSVQSGALPPPSRHFQWLPVEHPAKTDSAALSLPRLPRSLAPLPGLLRESRASGQLVRSRRPSHLPASAWAVPAAGPPGPGLCCPVRLLIGVPVCSPQTQPDCELLEGKDTGSLPSGPGPSVSWQAAASVQQMRSVALAGGSTLGRSVCTGLRWPHLNRDPNFPRCSPFMEAALPQPGMALVSRGPRGSRLYR